MKGLSHVAIAAALLGCSGPAELESAEQSLGQAERARMAVEGLENVTARGVDCHALDQYTASLGTLTVDCLGTIAPDSYRVSTDGALARNFASCPRDATRLQAIDQLLNLQQRDRQLPQVKACFAGRYADFLRDFADTGIAECPAWSDKETLNPITTAVIDEVTKLQPARDLLARSDDVLRSFELLEEKNRHRVSGGSAQAAARCAGGFGGFVIGVDPAAADHIITDPPAWLLDTVYLGADRDPYLRTGYFHPMSYYGVVPGVAFGDVNRYRPCPGCEPESCSYYAGLHLKTKLQLDCLDPADWATCVSYCGPKLP